MTAVTEPARDATAKGFFRGTHRTIPPEETLEWVRPRARRAGLTRLADATGLDRVGVPVVFAVRPNSSSLAVDGGKGLTTAAASVSAAMEGVERHCADVADVPAFSATWRELHEEQAVADWEALPLARHSVAAPDLPSRWVWTRDIAGSGGPLAMPAALVQIQPDRRATEPVDHQTSSNGLASGNTDAEAVAAGLYEVIERDAVTCWRLADRSGARALRRVDLATAPWESVQQLLDRFGAAGVQPVVFDCAVDTAVPTFMAYLIDRQQRHVGMCRGYGSHLDPQVALCRALTEAAQARVGLIAGARDERFRTDFVHARIADNERRVGRLTAIEPTMSLRAATSQATGTFDGDTATLLARLTEVGLNRVGVLDLTSPDLGVPVVRVHVPGLEGYLTPHYTPGSRARRFLEGEDR